MYWICEFLWMNFSDMVQSCHSIVYWARRCWGSQIFVEPIQAGAAQLCFQVRLVAICSIAVKKPRMHFSHRAPLQKRSVNVLTRLIMTSCYGRLLRGGFIFVKLSLSWERSLLNVWQCKVYGAEWEHALRTLSLTVWPQTKTRHSAHLENLSVGRWRESLQKKCKTSAITINYSITSQKKTSWTDKQQCTVPDTARLFRWCHRVNIEFFLNITVKVIIAKPPCSCLSNVNVFVSTISASSARQPFGHKPRGRSAEWWLFINKISEWRRAWESSQSEWGMKT